MTRTIMESDHPGDAPTRLMAPGEIEDADLLHQLGDAVADVSKERERFEEVAAMVAEFDQETAGDLIPVGLAPDVRALRGVLL